MITNSKPPNKKPLSPNRKNHHLVVLRGLLKYLKEDEKIDVYDQNLIKKYKVPLKEIQYLTKDELIRLADYPKESTITGLRMRAAIWVLISTGCRASEALNLRKSDIDFQNGVAHIRTKGSKPHTVFFNQPSLESIRKYLAMRNDNHEDLFVTAMPNPKPWSIGDLERSMKNIGRKLLQKNVHPHLIRKSSATLMYKEGVSIGVIQNFLNHSSNIVTSRHYLGNLGMDEVKKSHERVMGFEISRGEDNPIN